MIAYCAYLLTLDIDEEHGFGDDNLAEINIKMSESARTDDPHKTA